MSPFWTTSTPFRLTVTRHKTASRNSLRSAKLASISFSSSYQSIFAVSKKIFSGGNACQAHSLMSRNILINPRPVFRPFSSPVNHSPLTLILLYTIKNLGYYMGVNQQESQHQDGINGMSWYRKVAEQRSKSNIQRRS